jgi:hypothetical protein
MSGSPGALQCRAEAIRAAEHAAERDRLAQHQKQLEEELQLQKDIEAAAQMYARKRKADVRKRAMSTVKSLKAAVLSGNAYSLLPPHLQPGNRK